MRSHQASRRRVAGLGQDPRFPVGVHHHPHDGEEQGKDGEQSHYLPQGQRKGAKEGGQARRPNEQTKIQLKRPGKQPNRGGSDILWIYCRQTETYREGPAKARMGPLPHLPPRPPPYLKLKEVEAARCEIRSFYAETHRVHCEERHLRESDMAEGHVVR